MSYTLGQTTVTKEMQRRQVADAMLTLCVHEAASIKDEAKAALALEAIQTYLTIDRGEHGKRSDIRNALQVEFNQKRAEFQQDATK